MHLEVIKMQKGDGVQLLKYLLREKLIVIRERTPLEIILYSVFLYLCRLSLRDVAMAIRIFVKRSRTAMEMVTKIWWHTRRQNCRQNARYCHHR